MVTVPDDFVTAFHLVQCSVHNMAVSKGWWDTPRNDGEMIALTHQELSEALDCLRKGNPPAEHIPAVSGLEEEFADVVIRLMDFAAARNLRIAEAIIAKMEFNANRPHKHGKKF